MHNDGHYDNLETALADNFIQDQKKDAFDEYNNGGEGPDVDVRDEELEMASKAMEMAQKNQHIMYYLLSQISLLLD